MIGGLVPYVITFCDLRTRVVITATGWMQRRSY